jgi:hypothetical protein
MTFGNTNNGSRNTNTTFASAATLASPAKSARQRLMQRPSIHDSMLPPVVEEQRQFRTPIPLPNNTGYAVPPATQLLHHDRQSRTPAPVPAREVLSHTRVSPPPTQLLHHNNPSTTQAPAPTLKARPRARVAPPPTQLVNKASPRKRKLPEKEPQTQRLTRAQAKRSQAQEAEEQKLPGVGSSTIFPSTQLVEPAPSSRKKQKTTHVQESSQVKAKSGTPTRVTRRELANSKPNAAAGTIKNMATEPTQLVTRSPAKSNISKSSTSPVKRRNHLPASQDAKSPQEQKSLIVILRSPQKAAMIRSNESDDMQTSPADRVKMPPRKAAVAPLSRLKANSKPSSARKTASKPKPAVGMNRSGGRPRMKPEDSELDAY